MGNTAGTPIGLLLALTHYAPNWERSSSTDWESENDTAFEQANNTDMAAANSPEWYNENEADSDWIA